jgi:hypothetical protein
VDFGLGVDVDAAQRLVEDQELRVPRQPLADNDLLLVAPRQVLRWRRHVGDANVEVGYHAVG